MNDALNIIMICFNWMKTCELLTFTIGSVTVTLTPLNVAIGCVVVGIAIDVLHAIFEY